MKESVRNEIVRLAGQGLSQRRIAQQLRVSRHTVQRALQQVATARDEGAAAALPAPRSRSRRSLAEFDPVLQQLLELHLVLEREERRGVGAVAAHHHGRLLPVALDVDEPHRPPARLLADLHDRPACATARSRSGVDDNGCANGSPVPEELRVRG